jgi:drug/metabolite transporter (DMT)-like permease
MQDKVIVGHTWRGEDVAFYHPAVQSTFMFLGEFLCLLPHHMHRWRRRAVRRAAGTDSAARLSSNHQHITDTLREPLLLWSSDDIPLDNAGNSGNSRLREARHSVFVLALPTLLDAISTILMNISLYYTPAGTFQMLRGTLVFFAGALASP